MLLALLMVASPALCDGFDYSAYRPAQLADVANKLAKEVDPRVDYWIDASLPKYSTVVTLTGKRRAIDPGLRDYIAKWDKAMGYPASELDMFQTEIEVSQDSKTYWVPVQQQLLGPLDDEVASQGEVRLYILLMGAYRHSPVFSVAEFSAIGG